MKINRTTQIASLIVGAVIGYQLIRVKKKDSYFAFIKDENGEYIYENPNIISPIARLKKGEYVGALTGKTTGDFMEIEVSIGEAQNLNKYYFWIYNKSVWLIQGKEPAKKYMESGEGFDKSAQNQLAIVNYFNQ